MGLVKLRCSQFEKLLRSFFALFAFMLVVVSTIAQQKPNMVIFIADDLNQQDLGCYGNTDVKTPNIDALAAAGMRFNRTYAASSMCAPSRSVMFTGLYPFRNGSQMNHYTVRPNTKNLPQFLQKLGYRVVISGKTDVFPLKNFPFERIGEEFGKYAPVENRLDRKRETVRMIESHFKEKSQQPICLIVAPWVPHVPWFPKKNLDADKLKLPDYLADTKATRKALAAYYTSIEAADQFFGEVVQAIDKTGQANNTMVMFIADQGAQFPSAKWTVYDQGIRVPMIVRWPAKVKAGTQTDALVSLVDLTPTLIDLGGGAKNEALDGSSFKQVLLNEKKDHHRFIFAETSVEPHFWYNYTPSRTVITSDGFHYIRNYHAGVRFITHIDKVEQNEFYFDSWQEAAATDSKAKFLLDRYSYRPPEELFDLNRDRNEFKNLAGNSAFQSRLVQMKSLLSAELKRQGETEAMIIEGPLPTFFDQSYTLKQNQSAADLSFNKKLWNPVRLNITAYLKGVDKGGIVCDYFNNFNLYAYQNKLGLRFADGTELESNALPEKNGQLVMSLSEKGELKVWFNQQEVLSGQLNKDLTKIKAGYVTCGKLQGEELKGKVQPFAGTISDLRFTMNDLSREP